MKQKKEEIKKLRDRSIILIGFSGGFRRNEIVSLDYEDLDFVQEGLKINLEDLKQINLVKVTLKVSPTLTIHNIVQLFRSKNG